VYYGAAEREEPVARLLEAEQGVALIDGSLTRPPGPRHANLTVTGGFWGKAFAIAYVTSFDEARRGGGGGAGPVCAPVVVVFG
jgi:hypothetical protein